MSKQDPKLQKRVTVSGDPNSKPRSRQLVSALVRYKRWLLIIEVAIILLGGYFFLLQPQLRNITEVTADDVAYWEDQLAQSKRNRANAERLVKLYNSLDKNQRDKLEKMLPTAQQVPEFMAQLEELFDSEGMYMTEFFVSTLDFGEGAVMPFEILQFQISFTATDGYDSYRTILDKLERSVRIMNIQTFNYTEAQDGYTITGFVYFLEDNQDGAE